MRIKIGNWVGGAADESTGTVEWAGGYTDLDNAPFTMYVKNLTIEDYTTSGTEYTYGDETGDYTSIIISNSTTSNDTTSSSSSTTTTGLSYTANSTVGTSLSDNSTTSNSSSGSSTTSSSSSSTSSLVSAASMTGFDMGLMAVLGLALAYFL